ncbi:outer membrane protein [Rhizobium helianthi]|uniref:Outer membrane protein n=1 Tax=Rhizobium helianthi TaxID=1132695 RepID=A0ABW4M808_9HYPH
MKYSFAFAASIFLASSTAVFAADAVTQVPEAPAAAEAASAFTWAGPYAGAFGGYGWGEGKGSATGLNGKDNFDGARLGGFIGYNWVVSGGFVAGLEGDLGYDWNKNTYSVLGTNVDLGTGLTGSARARVGYGFDRALVYAAGGWTGTNVNLEATGVKISETFNGWTIGAGVDYAITDKMFARAEYRYNDFGDKTFDGGKISFDQHVVNVGVGVKF